MLQFKLERAVKYLNAPCEGKMILDRHKSIEVSISMHKRHNIYSSWISYCRVIGADVNLLI